MNYELNANFQFGAFSATFVLVALAVPRPPLPRRRLHLQLLRSAARGCREK